MSDKASGKNRAHLKLAIPIDHLFNDSFTTRIQTRNLSAIPECFDPSECCIRSKLHSEAMNLPFSRGRRVGGFLWRVVEPPAVDEDCVPERQS
jgi:hypothetical protein